MLRYKILSRQGKILQLCCWRCLPQKYSLRWEINWNSKESPIFRHCNHKKKFCCKISTFFGIKSEEHFLPKRNWNTCLCKPNKLYTVGNVMSWAKMFFSRYLNKIPLVNYLSWSYTEIIQFKKHMDGGSPFSLQLGYTYWLETVVLELTMFHRTYTKHR